MHTTWFDDELGGLALARARVTVHARHEEAPSFARRGLFDLNGLLADGGLHVDSADRGATDGEVQKDLGAHVFANVDDRAQATIFRRVGDHRRILEILGPDAEDQAPSLEAG